MNKFDFLDRFNKAEKLDIDRLAIEEFAAQVGGEVSRAENGRYLELLSDYKPEYLHGERALADILTDDSINLGFFEVNEMERRVDLQDIIFVDAETTGLSAASGTVAFLLGVGYLRGKSFRVHQFFLPDYPDEAAMLEAVDDLVEGRACVCTFNGKCFDLPLLETRYLMHRRQTPFAGMTRVDLLHSSRRFWRGRFVDNTLQTLEKELLGLYRFQDTPGHLIPQLYFDYLRTGDAGPLEGVLLHNRLDIVSLLFLLQVTQKYLDDAPRFAYYSPEEAYLISKHYFRRGDFAASCEAALSQFSNADVRAATVDLGFHLSMLQKRLGRYEEALTTYRRLCGARGEARLLALEGAAKLLEHKFRNHSEAEALTRAALEYLDSDFSGVAEDRTLFWNETLMKRRRRLLGKLK